MTKKKTIFIRKEIRKVDEKSKWEEEKREKKNGRKKMKWKTVFYVRSVAVVIDSWILNDSDFIFLIVFSCGMLYEIENVILATNSITRFEFLIGFAISK